MHISTALELFQILSVRYNTDPKNKMSIDKLISSVNHYLEHNLITTEDMGWSVKFLSAVVGITTHDFLYRLYNIKNILTILLSKDKSRARELVLLEIPSFNLLLSKIKILLRMGYADNDIALIFYGNTSLNEVCQKIKSIADIFILDGKIIKSHYLDDLLKESDNLKTVNKISELKNIFDLLQVNNPKIICSYKEIKRLIFLGSFLPHNFRCVVLPEISTKAKNDIISIESNSEFSTSSSKREREETVITTEVEHLAKRPKRVASSSSSTVVEPTAKTVFAIRSKETALFKPAAPVTLASYENSAFVKVALSSKVANASMAAPYPAAIPSDVLSLLQEESESQDASLINQESQCSGATQLSSSTSPTMRFFPPAQLQSKPSVQNQSPFVMIEEVEDFLHKYQRGLL